MTIKTKTDSCILCGTIFERQELHIDGHFCFRTHACPICVYEAEQRSQAKLERSEAQRKLEIWDAKAMPCSARLARDFEQRITDWEIITRHHLNSSPGSVLVRSAAISHILWGYLWRQYDAGSSVYGVHGNALAGAISHQFDNPGRHTEIMQYAYECDYLLVEHADNIIWTARVTSELVTLISTRKSGPAVTLLSANPPEGVVPQFPEKISALIDSKHYAD